MSENEKLNLILEGIGEIKDDVRGLKEDVQGLKEDVQVLKEDVCLLYTSNLQDRPFPPPDSEWERLGGA